MSTPSVRGHYVLGIDLGSASVGWAAIALEDGNPSKLLRAGVRIFEPAVTGDIESGRDESNAVARRAARLFRRQLRRRAARQRELFRLLQKHSLLPLYEGQEADGSQQRHSLLNCLDRKISAKWVETGGNQATVELPLYILRKAALDFPLEPFELGRVFYHLSQRRGYRSNRKELAGKQEKGAKSKKDNDFGQVEAEIKTLSEEIHRSGARTLGEYFASLDPHLQKVRRRWTDRKMYENEFAQIWEKQIDYRPALLTDELHREIKRLLFYQRPTKKQSHLIGECELEPGERRAAWATREAQQFRVLQKTNDLELIYPGQITGVPLTCDQRKKVLDLLCNSTETTFKKIRKELGLQENVGFNLQRGGETQLKGNLTDTIMVAAFGERWAILTEDQRKQAVEDWRTIERDESLIRRAVEYWKLDEPGAEWLVSHPAPSGYCSLSHKAIRKLMPLMQEGKRFKEAENEIYGTRFSGGKIYDRIPPVREALKTLRNPAIERALTELRKVVNALIREMGQKPAEIRIELARDLKKPRKERAEATTKNRSREKERMGAKARLLRELGPGFEHPSRADIEKALLHEECGGICPYTGRHIEFASLFGQRPQFDVEHIIPFGRIPDDSFQNKTLCYHEENRNVKLNKTPFEAYKDAEQYERIMTRVRSWPKPNSGKLARFELKTTDQLEGFSSRQLNDTRYASKLACDLMATLYGGRDVVTESGSRQVVFASSGKVTATLRRGWGLEAILREAAPSANGLNKGKLHTDHRHHAIDAIVISLNRPEFIAALSRANAEDPYWPPNGRSTPNLQVPWKDFVPSIRSHIDQMLVSHRPEHRLTGALHNETNYGRPRREGGKDLVHIRKPVPGLSASDIASIVDPSVREVIVAKAAEFGGDLKTWTPGDGKGDWPQLKTRAGRSIPIKRVRIKKTLTVQPIAQGPRTRNVALSSNHHVAIFALIDDAGREGRWESITVSLYEALERKRKGLPVIQTRYTKAGGYQFRFALMGGDSVLLHRECNHKEGACLPSLWRLRSIASNGALGLVRINDARPKADIQKAKELWSPTVHALRKLDAVKVEVDSLGRLHKVKS
jgi:CRISPR-associated endonuclease Csn1